MHTRVGLFFLLVLLPLIGGTHALASSRQTGADYGSITGVALSPDGANAALAGADGYIRLWDIATRQAAASWRASAGIEKLIYSPDGNTIAAAADDGPVHLLNSRTLQEDATLVDGPDAATPTDLAFSPDGRTLASTTLAGAVLLWDVASRNKTATLHEASSLNEIFAGGLSTSTEVAFSPDNRYIAYTDPAANIHLWDRTAQREDAVLKASAELQAGNLNTGMLAFSSDSKTVAVGIDDAVYIWNIQTRDNVARIDVDDTVGRGAFFQNGRFLAAAVGRSVIIWNASSKQQAARLEGHEAGVSDISFDLSGRLLATSSADGTVRLWDTASWTQIARLGQIRVRIQHIAYSPDGRNLVTADDGPAVHIFDLDASREAGTLWSGDNVTWTAGFSPDGALLAAGTDRHLLVWEFTSGAVLTKIQTSDDVYSLTFSRDGHHLAYAESSGAITVLNLPSFDRAAHWQAGDVVRSLAYSADGSQLAVGLGVSQEHHAASIKLYDATTGAQQAALGTRSGLVTSIAISPDGATLAAVDGPDIVLFDYHAGTELTKLPTNDTELAEVAFSPDGHLLASAGYLVGIWDLSTETNISSLHVPGGLPAASVSFSPDGSTLAAGGINGVIQLWDVPY